MNLIFLIVCLFINFCNGSVIDCENGCLDRPMMLSNKATFQLNMYTLITEPLSNGTRFTLKSSGGKAKIVNVNLNDTKSSTTIVGQCDYSKLSIGGYLLIKKINYEITSQLKNINIKKDKCTWLLPVNVTIPGSTKRYATRNSTYWMQVVADGKVVLENKHYRISFASSTVGNLVITVFLIALSWIVS